ncbi:MAG: hypothetical protein RL227_2625 [Pseudomonadota bacterium]
MIGLLCLLAACGAESPKALLEQARAFESRGDKRSALVQYKSALQAEPGLVAARVALGKLLLSLGDGEGAAVEFQRAVADKAPTSEVYPLWAAAVVQTGDYKRAVHLFASWNFDNPATEAAVLSQLANAWSGLGDRARAEATVARALEIVPKFAPARLQQARIAISKGQVAEAEQAVNALLAEDARYVDALMFKAAMFDARGEVKQALSIAESVLAVESTHLPAHAMLTRIHLEVGDLPGARKQVVAMRASAGWHPSTVLAEAQLALAEEDFVRARERIQRLLSVLPDNEMALATAGVIEVRAGSLVQAVAHFRKALANEPQLEPVRLELARAEIRLGQYADAIGTLQPLLAVPQPGALALALASEVQVRLGNHKLADHLLQRASSAAPDNTRLQTARLMRELQLGDAARPLLDLQSLAGRSKDTYVDEALFAARMARGEFGAALAVLDTMAKKNPDRAKTYELRGRVYLAQRDFKSSRRAFERALQLDKALFGSVASLVALDLLDNQPDKAIARVQAVVDSDPQHSVALMALAELKSRHGGSPEEAARLLKAAAVASPLAAEPRIRLIDQALRKRRFKEALTHAQEALAAIPGDGRLLEAAGRAQLEAGDVEQAASTFRSMAGAMPASGVPYVRLARAYMIQGNRDAALTALRKAVELEPANAEAQSGLVEVLISLNQSRSALDYVARQKQLRPKDPAVYALEAAYRLRVKAPDAAVAALREGLARTRSPDLARRQFSLLLQLGRDAEAARFGNDWMRQFPNDAAFEYLMAVRDIARGDLTTAEARLRRVLEVYPTNGLALNNMAWLLVKNGGKGAVEYARRAVSVMPDQPDMMDTLAMALAADQKLPEALAIQRRALELSEGRPDIRIGLARLALQAGDKATAREELTKLDQLGTSFKGHAEVKTLMQKL